MNTYAIWCDVDGNEDLAFADAVGAYLEHLRAEDRIDAWTLERRKFGFGPDALGEFHIRIQTRDLAQLDSAFQASATRAGEVERLHAEVFRRVRNFRSALYRPFPDPVRVRASV